jgi:hypothetical protein
MRRTHPFWGIMWYNQLYTFKMCCYTLWHTHPQLVGLLLGETFYHISELSRTTHIWTNQCLIQQLKSRHVGLVTRTKTILPVTLRWAGYAVNNQEILDTSMLWFMKTCESSKLSDENICIIHAHIICMSIIYIYYYTCSIVIQYFIHGWPIIWSQSLSSIQIKDDRLVTSSTSLTGHVLSSMARPGSKSGSICLAEFYSWSVAHSMRTHDRQTPLTPLCSRFLLGKSQICHPQLLAKILPRNNHHFHPSQKITISTNHPKYAWNLWNNNYIITI